MTSRSARATWLVVAVAILAVFVTPLDAVAQRSRTAADVERDIAEYSKLLEQMRDEYKKLEKQRDAGISAMVGAGPKYPGAPSGWDDFSISVDVNNDPGSAIVHYQHEMEIAKAHVDEGERIVRDLREELQRKRSPVPTPARTTPPSTGTAPTGTTPPVATTAPPAATGTGTPKKDMNCLCRCSCAAAGFNVNNVRSYYSTSPVHHTNPNGAVSESCMNPSEGPCVCQGFVCRRASLVSTGSCADGCAR